MLRKSNYCSTRFVRILLATLICGLCCAANVAAQSPPPPVATASQSFGVDYKDADLSAGGVVRFEQQIDAGAWASLTIPPKANDALTPAGSSTYKTPIPAMTTGAHTVAWRACNASMCSVASAPFAFVLSVQPAAPSGGRILSGS